MKKILIDCNCIDFLLTNEKEFLEKKNEYKYFVSSSVVEEIATISDDKINKRISLFLALCKIGASFLNDSCFILGKARLGFTNLGEGKVYSEILNESQNNTRDSIIADTAVTNDCVLLTNDSKFCKKMKRLGYAALSFEEFISET